MATKKLGRKSWENCYNQCSRIKNDDEFNINLVFKGLKLLGVEDDDVLDDIYIAGEEGEYPRSRITIKEWNDVLNNVIKYTNKELLKGNEEKSNVDIKYTFIVNMIGNTLRLLDDDIEYDCDEIDHTCSWFSERNIYTSCEEEIIREIYDESKSKYWWDAFKMIEDDEDLKKIIKEIDKYLNSQIPRIGKYDIFGYDDYNWILINYEDFDNTFYNDFDSFPVKKDRIILPEGTINFIENDNKNLLLNTYKKYFKDVRYYNKPGRENRAVIFYNKGVSIKDSTNLFFKIFVEICKKTGCFDRKTNLMESFNGFADL